MGASKEIRNEYKATWKEFARRLNELQQLAESGDRDQIEAALLNVEQARLRHNAARDRLAAELTGKQAQALAPVGNEKVVRNTARLLWEFAGKPHGTAERDWFRAEGLVRAASQG